MNRADQAPEPSMEELLASIRLIISDADRKPTLASVDSARRSPTVAGTPSLPGDEVLDLTDELVSLEEERGSSPAAIPEADEAFPMPSSVSNIKQPAPASLTQHQAEPSGGLAQPQQPKGPVPQRPLWSRRGLPLPASSIEQASKPRQNAAEARAPNHWPEDIQMPVPENGPVALVSPAGQAPDPIAAARTDVASHERNISRVSRLEGDDEASVAEFAQRLARSAVGSMEGNELATAQQVNFESLDRGSRDEVTEKFADAIERGSNSLGKPMLPSLLDEVFRQDFRRDAAVFSAGAEAEEPAAEEGEGRQELAPAAQPEPALSRDASRIAQLRAPHPSFPGAQQVSPAQALVPAQAAAASQPARTLEDAVREMLRPLLVQWLNENMPRILESAIREEIAARGLIPGAER